MRKRLYKVQILQDVFSACKESKSHSFSSAVSDRDRVLMFLHSHFGACIVRSFMTTPLAHMQTFYFIVTSPTITEYQLLAAL